MQNAGKYWLIALMLLGGGVAAWYYFSETPPPAPVVVPEPSAPAAVESTAPRYPVPRPGRQQQGERELMPLPPLDDSDSYFALALIDLLGGEIDTQLVKTGLIERIVTTTDNLTRSHIAERIRPLRAVPGTFLADAEEDEESYTLDPANFARYEFLVAMLERADIEQLVDTYRRFYPLFQEAYVNQGYPDLYFNDRVVEVIDHLLETAGPDDPIRLIRPHVSYEFADPNLESLSSGQKMLLRMGPENAARVQQFLSTLRSQLVAPDGT